MGIALALSLLLVAAPQGLEVTGLNYQAVVGPTGALASLRVGALEALSMTVVGGGGVLLGPEPVPLVDFSQRGGLTSARGVDALVTYEPLPEGLAIHVLNGSQAARKYRLATATGWAVHGPVAASLSGATITVSQTLANPADPWTLEVEPFGAETLSVTFMVPPNTQPAKDTLWCEPWRLRPGPVALPAVPPFASPDGRYLNLPLVICNDADTDRPVTVTVELGGHTATDRVTLSPRRAHALQLRLPAPLAGSYAVHAAVDDEAVVARASWQLEYGVEEAQPAANPSPASPPSEAH